MGDKILDNFLTMLGPKVLFHTKRRPRHIHLRYLQMFLLWGTKHRKKLLLGYLILQFVTEDSMNSDPLGQMANVLIVFFVHSQHAAGLLQNPGGLHRVAHHQVLLAGSD